MAWLGWAVCLIIAAWASFGSFSLLALSTAFDQKGETRVIGLILGAIATMLWWVTFNYAPFTVTVK